MTGGAGELRRGDCLSPTDLALLGNPLDFIHEDHLRERNICAMLDRIAGSEDDARGEAPVVLEFLREELPLHLADEEQDLFPLLRRRCPPEDDIAAAIRRIAADHKRAGDDTPDVIAILDRLVTADRAPADEARSALIRFAAHARRHLIFENAIILPFARLRLTRHDLASLRLRMLQRRDLDLLLERADAE